MQSRSVTLDGEGEGEGAGAGVGVEIEIYLSDVVTARRWSRQPLPPGARHSHEQDRSRCLVYQRRGQCAVS